MPKGLTDYGAAAQSWNQYAEASGLTPEQKQAGLDKLAKGDLPEGANITKAIVEGYQDGVMIAGAWYLGPAASVGKVIGGGVIGVSLDIENYCTLRLFFKQGRIEFYALNERHPVTGAVIWDVIVQD
ncbi:TPA: hypothetical protein ACGHLA_000594 [Salmonella enterica subsp. enterica serovar Bovismorbificans]